MLLQGILLTDTVCRPLQAQSWLAWVWIKDKLSHSLVSYGHPILICLCPSSSSKMSQVSLHLLFSYITTSARALQVLRDAATASLHCCQTSLNLISPSTLITKKKTHQRPFQGTHPRSSVWKHRRNYMPFLRSKALIVD